MAYVNSTRAGRPSTTLISSRIQKQYIAFAEDNGFVFNKWANKALETFIHDLQTDHNITHEKRWLQYSGGCYTAYDTDSQGSTTKMLRIQTHLIEYLRMNMYKVNAALNLALQRWVNYYKHGQVADYVIGQLQRRGKL